MYDEQAELLQEL